MDLTPLLTEMVDNNASDLFISVGAPPTIKVEGRSQALGSEALDAPTVYRLCYSIMSDEQTSTFEGELELNLALDVKEVAVSGSTSSVSAANRRWSHASSRARYPLWMPSDCRRYCWKSSWSSAA